MFLLTHREEETTVSAGENTKHTPGPWVATPSDPAEGVECIWITACPAPNQEKEIAAVYGPQNEKNKATAALIAAALRCATPSKRSWHPTTPCWPSSSTRAQASWAKKNGAASTKTVVTVAAPLPKLSAPPSPKQECEI